MNGLFNGTLREVALRAIGLTGASALRLMSRSFRAANSFGDKGPLHSRPLGVALGGAEAAFPLGCGIGTEPAVRISLFAGRDYFDGAGGWFGQNARGDATDGCGRAMPRKQNFTCRAARNGSRYDQAGHKTQHDAGSKTLPLEHLDSNSDRKFVRLT